MVAKTVDPAHESSVPAAIFDLTEDTVVIVGPRRRIVRMNGGAERMFGYRSDEIAGQPIDRLLDALVLDADRGGSGDTRPRAIQHVDGLSKDGARFPLEVKTERVEAASGPLVVLCAQRPKWARTTTEDLASVAARFGVFGYWRWDLETNTVSMSEEVRQILQGAPRTLSTGAPEQFRRYITPAGVVELDKALRRAIASRERFDVTYEIVTADGTHKVLRSLGDLRLSANGRVREILGITLDVTERERVSEALRESENTLNAIVNSTTAMIYIKDIEGKYLLVNRHFEEVFGVDNHELRGKDDHSLFTRDVADSVRENDRLVREAGRPVEFEEVVPHKGEDHIYISIKFPLRRSNGEIYAVCGISTDITERKRAQSELEETKRSLERLVDQRTAILLDTNRRLQEEITERKETASQLQRLIDTAREGIWIIDETGLTTFANPRMAEILGYDTSEMVGRPMFDFMTERRRADAARNLERRRQGISEDHDFEFRRKDGSVVWTLLSTSPVMDNKGRMIGALAMVTDITERKRAEEHQSMLLQELDHRVKNTLATVVAISAMTMARAKTVEDFANAFSGRIQAMARTHEALARSKWQSVSLEQLVSLILAPLPTEDPSRFSVYGDPVPIPPYAIAPLALTLNELGTNALKHGALSNEQGKVQLAWGDRGADNLLSLTWRETGGPRVEGLQNDGTGLQLIRGLVEYELRGYIELDLAPDGLVCRIAIPISEVN